MYPIEVEENKFKKVNAEGYIPAYIYTHFNIILYNYYISKINFNLNKKIFTE